MKCRCKSIMAMMEFGHFSNPSAQSWGDVSDNTITNYWCTICGRFLQKHTHMEDWYEPKNLEGSKNEIKLCKIKSGRKINKKRS